MSRWFCRGRNRNRQAGIAICEGLTARQFWRWFLWGRHSIPLLCVCKGYADGRSQTHKAGACSPPTASQLQCARREAYIVPRLRTAVFPASGSSRTHRRNISYAISKMTIHSTIHVADSDSTRQTFIKKRTAGLQNEAALLPQGLQPIRRKCFICYLIEWFHVQLPCNESRFSNADDAFLPATIVCT